jgi:hypothetical protein
MFNISNKRLDLNLCDLQIELPDSLPESPHPRTPCKQPVPSFPGPPSFPDVHVLDIQASFTLITSLSLSLRQKRTPKLGIFPVLGLIFNK